MPENISQPTSSPSPDEAKKDYIFGIALIVMIFLALIGTAIFLVPPVFGMYAKPLLSADALAMLYCICLFIRRRP